MGVCVVGLELSLGNPQGLMKAIPRFYIQVGIIGLEHPRLGLHYGVGLVVNP